MKRFAALARVSSREQQREGFSLDVQVEALTRWAAERGGEIVHLVKIAETASKREKRHEFKSLLGYCKANAKRLDGLLIYKLDRWSRNLPDYVELLKLRSEYGLKVHATSQPTDDSPAGRAAEGFMAVIAALQTDQQAKDVREGHERRVRDGYFACSAPYGYKLERRDGRSVVVTDERAAANVRRVFQLYATGRFTLDGVVEQLAKEGREYRGHGANGQGGGKATFNKTRVHGWLASRAYIGEVEYQGQWFPGRHEPIVDRAVWMSVQERLNGRNASAKHEMAYAGELVNCGGCGRPVTGETKIKGGKEYRYYRCARYSASGHPGGKVRVTEGELDAQVMALFTKMRVADPDLAEWFRDELRLQTEGAAAELATQRAELQRQAVMIAGRKDRLLEMRLDGAIDTPTFASKQSEIQRLDDAVTEQLRALGRGQDEAADVAIAAFELSQSLEKQWKTADFAVKRRILEIVSLNRVLDGKTLKIQLKKPFSLLAEGLAVPANRGGGI